MKQWILSRRDQTEVAWHEVPGNKRKVEPVPKGLDASFFFFPGTSCQATLVLIPPG